MLSTMRSSWLLFALFALFAFSSALNIGDLNLDGIEEYLNHGVKRQAQGTGNTPTQQPTSAPPTSAPPSTPEPSPEPTPTPEPSTDNPPSSNNPPSSGNNDNTSPPASSRDPATSAPPTSSANPPRSSSSDITAPVTETTPLVTLSTSDVVTTYTTKSNGQDVVATSTSKQVSTRTTGMATNTRLPGTQGNGGSSSDGMSSKTKSIIGGVVGGVGGALLLGGIALVCWRMWGKKKNRVTEDDADLMAGTGAALGDKPQNSTPFQSNLEQYHNPGGRPNAAANF
ncbi:unnamed protein product [Periconia digitata]|uniref:Mid2 domain-containing protein n=1 Tax=Periconia digitata TaxID=1303443 RepID=A0A9W4UM71_9PLEO|nr:unnamed protein product [Periconia digitata]